MKPKKTRNRNRVEAVKPKGDRRTVRLRTRTAVRAGDIIYAPVECAELANGG